MRRKKDDNYDVNSCVYCVYWQGRKNGCRLGEENCILLNEEQEIEKSPCDGCAYANPVPCIGYCLKQIQQEMKDKKSQAEGGGSDVVKAE